MTKQDRICMISLFAVMLVLMGVPALCLSTNTVVDELGTLTNTALLTGRNWGTGILSNGGYYYRYGMAFKIKRAQTQLSTISIISPRR